MRVGLIPLCYGGVSLTSLTFKPRILRGFQESLKINPGKNNPKNSSYFFLLAEVTSVDMTCCDLLCVLIGHS